MTDASLTLASGNTYHLGNVTIKHIDYGRKPIPIEPIYNRPYDPNEELVLVPAHFETTVRLEWRPTPNLYPDLLKNWQGFGVISMWSNGRKAEQDVAIVQVGENNVTLKLMGEPRFSGLENE
jgi:hypothetical protein